MRTESSERGEEEEEEEEDEDRKQVRTEGEEGNLSSRVFSLLLWLAFSMKLDVPLTKLKELTIFWKEYEGFFCFFLFLFFSVLLLFRRVNFKVLFLVVEERTCLHLFSSHVSSTPQSLSPLFLFLYSFLHSSIDIFISPYCEIINCGASCNSFFFIFKF
jgi:hypothetical protein